MDKYDWALLFFCAVIAIGNRGTAPHNDFFRFNPPLWVRRILFVVDIKSQTIGLGTIITQLAFNIFIVISILSLFNLADFSFLPGEYHRSRALLTFIMAPVMGLSVIYTCVCDFVINRREKRKQKEEERDNLPDVLSP